MSKATMQIVGPDGRRYIADPEALGKVIVGETGRVSCFTYHDDRPMEKPKGRPDVKFRVKQLCGLTRKQDELIRQLGLLAMLERKEGAAHA